ncbi:MAG: DUF1573 domain-containing protein [Spirochaetales bacterium]|nr:DUF1573 domain-containing protein [Spirochaetales bacterium]
MNKQIITFGLLMLLPLLFVSGCFSNKKPSIYVDGEKYKFGRIREGKEVVFTFFFSNTGTAPLRITELNVSCSCVVVKYYDKIVKPGKRGKIYGKIETEGFRGAVTKAIKMKTNIPDKPEVILTLEGTILPRTQ